MHSIGVFAGIFDEERRILLVRMAYGNQNWTTPGGALETGETIDEGLKREVLEETGYRINPEHIIGAYSKLEEDEVVIFIEASILGREPWEPDEEIAEIRFFAKEQLPDLINPRPALRIADAFNEERGILREF